jgi:hypothetical protein
VDRAQRKRKEQMTLQYIQPKDAAEFLASKWLHFPFLVETDELKHLFDTWGNFSIFSCMGMQEKGKNSISCDAFLDTYSSYISALKHGTPLQDAAVRFAFTSLMTQKEDAIQAIEVQQTKEIIRAKKPIIQSQLHRFDYSDVDGKFRSMVFGNNTISWGLQFSYPQLYQDPLTRTIYNALDEKLFPNAHLFQKLKSWIRAETIPTPFLVQGKKTHCPIRIGKKCLSWIHKHPELHRRGIEVHHD